MAKKKVKKAEEPRGDVINYSHETSYVPPSEDAVKEQLEWFRDQKLGFMVHWGPYSQLGVVESWQLSEGDADWARDGVDWASDGDDLREKYFGLANTFNPLRFHPDQWARFAKDAGFRYLVFTTKHHDGFCMFDSQYSDYKTTSPDCPFHTHKYADIARHLFDAFREEGLGIIPYFSKPDWHCPWYWAPGQEKPIAFNRNPTYNPLEKPELWNKFVEFTHNQMMELVTDYGPVKGLWLDGGQVKPRNNQDLRMEEFAKKSREHTPALMIADRTVGGPFENYITPEMTVPDHAISVPWESCVIIGGGFSFAFGADYKNQRELVHLLMRVVSRGGNLALNLGGQPDGRLPRQGMMSALQLGEWLKTYGEAVYETRLANPHALNIKQGRQELEVVFTQNEHKGRVYAVVLLKEEQKPINKLRLPISLLPRRAIDLKDGAELMIEEGSRHFTIQLQKAIDPREEPALVLALEHTV